VYHKVKFKKNILETEFLTTGVPKQSLITSRKEFTMSVPKKRISSYQCKSGLDKG